MNTERGARGWEERITRLQWELLLPTRRATWHTGYRGERKRKKGSSKEGKEERTTTLPRPPPPPLDDAQGAVRRPRPARAERGEEKKESAIPEKKKDPGRRCTLLTRHFRSSVGHSAPFAREGGRREGKGTGETPGEVPVPSFFL